MQKVLSSASCSRASEQTIELSSPLLEKSAERNIGQQPATYCFAHGLSRHRDGILVGRYRLGRARNVLLE